MSDKCEKCYKNRLTAVDHIIMIKTETKHMTLKENKIISRASGLSGKITGIDNGYLKITFTNFQDISIPLSKAEDLLIMDDETLNRLHEKMSTNKTISHHKSKVQTYMDDYDEEDAKEEAEADPDDEDFDIDGDDWIYHDENDPYKKENAGRDRKITAHGRDK